MIDKNKSEWVVVGAGAAGILAVGRLLDAGISAHDILWLDAEFAAGDLGKYWSQVPSNTRVSFFKQFFYSTASFCFSDCPSSFKIFNLEDNQTCLLADVVEVLQWISDHLCAKVNYKKCLVRSLSESQACWSLFADELIFAKNVILAIGAFPKVLHYDMEISELPLHLALNPSLLKTRIKPENEVLVFGSSHSAILAIKNCLDLGSKVVNIYRSPLRYALYQPDHIIYDNTGLKGDAAQWAKENLHSESSFSRLKRICSHDCSEEEMALAFQSADYVVYAVGFSARKLPSHGLDCKNYDAHTGIIAPGLFGLGIAYPELVTDRYGITEWNIGLFKFSSYLTKVLPLWMNYGR